MMEPKTTQEATKDDDQAQPIIDFGSVITKTDHGSVCCVTIIGQIEGHTTGNERSKATKYEHMLPMLVKLEQSNQVDGVIFLLNTVGGDIEAGLAIAELMASMKKPTVSLILGGSHSIGVPLAVATDRSFAVPSAAMTIHPVRMSGTVIAAPQTYQYFQRLQERIVDFVANHCGVTSQRFTDLMLATGDMASDVGSVLYGQQAVDEGIVDQLGGLGDALDWLYEQMKR